MKIRLINYTSADFSMNWDFMVYIFFSTCTKNMGVHIQEQKQGAQYWVKLNQKCDFHTPTVGNS